MSERGTLAFYFMKRKANVHAAQESLCESIQSTINEYSADEVLNSNNSSTRASSSTSSAPTLIIQTVTDTNSDTVNGASTLEYSRAANSGGMISVEFVQRDPSRGPTFAKEFVSLGPHQPKYNYPTIEKRHFCHKWFKSYPWLEYSITNNKAYCFFCRFAYDPVKSDEIFTITGFNNWKKGIEKFNKHQSSLLHKLAHEKWTIAEKNRINNTNVLINYQDNNFLGKQCLSLRGHREHEEAENRGNFLELLQLRSSDNDIIKRKLSSLKFTDHKIQNELLISIQENITEQIVSDIKKSKYFSVMIDETTDISNHQQVSLVIRYVDDFFNVYERFLGFERTFDTTAIYIHCNGHVLNLCLIDVSSAIVPIRNNFGVIEALYNFFEGSAKRHHVFEDVQKQAGLKAIVMKRLCDTRWTCRSECLTVVLNRYSEILDALETVSNGFIMLNTIKRLDFIFHLIIMSEVYSITNILSRYLQHSSISLSGALVHVKLTIETLSALRTESKFEEFWKKTIDICEANDIDDQVKIRKRKIPAKLGGGYVIPDDFSLKDNYRVNSYFAVIEKVTAAIDNRFDENNVEIVVLCERLFLTKNLLLSDEILQLTTFYGLSYTDCKSEQLLYKTALNQQQSMNMDIKSITKFFLQKSFHLALPTMNELLRILWTIPVNVCECERSFSCLRRLKTYLRSTMDQERLSALALVHIERDIIIDIDKIVEKFVRKNDTRKTQFSY
ncbi:unnamed protein product [Adineta ricciae]|uniref:TTF-type domain-containing protein n=1 Tax=Adineta ricciae TaxID=249248 RepID=A0A815NQ20_ADIRI|nr:unnamed protein product [Adineta ricciae]CAF1614274.1 unnamed protein product [Adineta ricciae]